MENLASTNSANQTVTNRYDLVGNSPATLRLVDLAKRVASSAAPVLLVGPPGSEFEVVAGYIHRHSSQAALPFVRQRCACWQDLVEPSLVAPDLAEPNLAEPKGMLGSGTLFVEGIEHASLPVQLRLLNELEQSQLMRLKAGGAATQTQRIIASTTADLTQLVANGLFLDELYWQLSPLTIPLPPLKQRGADVAEIAWMLLAQIVAIYHPAIQPSLTSKSIQQLQAYDWPGNFRELYSTLQRETLLTRQAELWFDLSSSVAAGLAGTAGSPKSCPATESAAPPALDFAGLVQAVVHQGIIEADRGHRELYQFIVDHVESALISAVLEECENVQTKTATRLGINRNTLHKKMKDFGLEPSS